MISGRRSCTVVAASIGVLSILIFPVAVADGGEPLERVREAWLREGVDAADRTAEALAESSGDVSPDRLRLVRGWLRMAAGDRSEALALWAEIAAPGSKARPEMTVTAIARVAAALECAGQIDRAAGLRERLAAALSGEHSWAAVETFAALGRLRAAMGDDARAAEAFRAAHDELEFGKLELPGFEAALLDGLAAALRRAGEEKKATKIDRQRAKLDGQASSAVADPCAVRPVPVTIVTPDYPEEARRERWEGAVAVHCGLDERGATTACDAVGGTGRFRAFEDAAVRAVESWTWFPVIVDGEPAQGTVVTDLTFSFR